MSIDLHDQNFAQWKKKNEKSIFFLKFDAMPCVCVWFGVPLAHRHTRRWFGFFFLFSLFVENKVGSLKCSNMIILIKLVSRDGLPF